MKKCLHLTHTDIASDSRILKEISSLADAGYEVHGIGVTRDDGGSPSGSHPMARIESIQLRSRKLTLLPRALRHALTLSELIAKFMLRTMRQRPDIVHCHDTLVLPVACIVKVITRSKLVYDAHELESDRNGISNFHSRLTLLVERRLWRFVDALVVVSPSIEKWYHSNVGPKPSVVVLNAPQLSSETASGNPTPLREKFSIPSDSRIFIYVGILGRGRGIEAILNAFTEPEASAHVVFLGYGEFMAVLRDAEAVHPNVHVHEAVPHADVVSVVRSADYGLCLVENVSLSDYYCLPNKLFEYCFAGVPVLASDFPDIRSVVTGHDIGECCGTDPQEVKRAVEQLQSSKKQYAFRGLGSLSWEAQANALIGLYESLC